LYGEDLKTMGEFAVEAGQSVPFVLFHGASFQNPSPPIDPFNALERTEAFWREWSDRCPQSWALDRVGKTFTHYIEGFDLRANGRDRRCCHDLASRAPGRREELGLPILLAAGCHLHALGVYAPRILRRSAGLARLAHSGCRRQPEPSPDHVWRRRRAVVAGTD